MDSPEIIEAAMDAQKDAIMERRKAHFKIVADLFARGTADVSNDPRWVAMLNKPQGFRETNPKMSLEQYMACFPEDVADAMKAAEFNRNQLQNDGVNKHSLAYYSFLGCAPECISKLFNEVYTDKDERRKAWRTFFHEFPVFKVTTRPIFS